MGRREQREQIFRLLFCVEFHDKKDLMEQEGLFLERMAAYPVEENLSFSDKDTAYITAKYEGVVEKIPEMDAMINEKVEGWDTKRMGKVELSIIRLAVYEILYDEDIPNSVAVNEAVELAKRYGQDNAGSFVNAVLAKFLADGKETDAQKNETDAKQKAAVSEET